MTSDLLRTFNPLWLAGPIFDKELRVASRQRRTYAIRAGYLLLMSLTLLSAWYSIRRAQISAVLGASLNAFLAMNVTIRLIHFQFMAAQILAAVALAGSIGDEIRKGSLGVLLSTPMTSAQIVVGKLLSGLLQVVLLLAISLPALAAVRVMGGIPWTALWAGLCVTLTAALFCGVLCLWLGTYYRRPYQIISAGTVVYLVALMALPALVALAGSAVIPGWGPSVQALIDPRRAISAQLSTLWGGGAPVVVHFSWPAHCLVMLVITFLLFALSVQRIRRMAFPPAAARGVWFGSAEPLGLPSVWKRGSNRLWALSRIDKAAILGALATAVLAVWSGMTHPRGYDTSLNDIAWVFSTVALLQMAVLAAGGIARDKESGAWPLLLTTPLDDRQIVRGKARVALRRGLPLLLAALVVRISFMMGVGVPNNERVVYAMYYTFPFLASAFFILAAGLYFGIRLRTTTAAVSATVAAYLGLNYFVAGYYSPLFVWLQYTLVYARPRPSLYIFGMAAAPFVLDIVLGVVLIRRAHHHVRTAST